MKPHNFNPYVKYGLFFICIISLVDTAYADTNVNNINNLSKVGGVALSWDDSPHIDPCYHYLSLFQKYNATCTMNVNRLNTQTEINELNSLHSAGWEIASHGYDHMDSRIFLSNSTPTAWLNQEIFPSVLEVSSYNYPVYTFVYPYSSRNATTDAILAPYFRTLRTIAPHVVNGNVNETTLAYYKWDDAQLLYGIEIDDRSNVSLQSIEYGIDHAIKTGTVLVLYGHLITPTVNGQYQTSTSKLDSILNYTSRNGGVFYHMGDLGNSSWTPLPRFSNVTANYTVSTNSLLAEESVTFVDTSINQTTELLDFGDGSPMSNTANITHTYTTPGVYTANLTVKNDVFSDSMLQKITVFQPSIPGANFTSNCTIGPQPLNIAFIDTSTGFPTSWSWDFGDEDTSTSQNPVHEYSNAGNYSVKLTVANDKGSNYIQKVNCITVLSHLTKLPQSPSSNFSSNIITGNIPLTVQFKDTSTGSPTSWDWDFGDGYTSNEQNPAHTFFSAGTYNINLIVSNANGTDSKTAIITAQSQSSSNGDSNGGSIHNSGSSGGGGAGGSPEPQSNVEIKELSQTFIASGQSVNFDFPQKVTPIVNISFDSKKTVGKTTTIVEMLKGKSTLASGLPSDEVYKYLNIWIGNGRYATPKNIENAVVCFKVEKSWVRDKKIDKSSITLNRFDDSKWSQLPTKLSGEDDKYLYFTAQTAGFSPFVITGKITTAEIIQPLTDKTQPAVSDTQNKSNIISTAANAEQTSEQTQSSNTSGKENTKTPGFESFFGIVSLLVVFQYKIR
jgi:PGF-pre-PGF domain-containing protein